MTHIYKNRPSGDLTYKIPGNSEWTPLCPGETAEYKTSVSEKDGESKPAPEDENNK